MKILIAYDASECSDAAILDLHRAGLPPAAEVIVVSVADLPPDVNPPPSGPMVDGPGMAPPPAVEGDAFNGHQLRYAHHLATQAADRLRLEFPHWHITTEALLGAAGPAIVKKARAWKSDLVIVGSHGRSGIKRLLLGSVSHYVLKHVNCSVRISRCLLHAHAREIRLLIGVDGSTNAAAAVQTVASRTWPAGTQMRVVGVIDARIPAAAAGTLEGAIPASIEDESLARTTEPVLQAVAILAQSHLHATPMLPTGIPSELLQAEAEKWHADSLFVGALGLNALERMLLGSVSLAVAARSPCSVEVVRPPTP